MFAKITLGNHLVDYEPVYVKISGADTSAAVSAAIKHHRKKQNDWGGEPLAADVKSVEIIEQVPLPCVVLHIDETKSPSASEIKYEFINDTRPEVA